jgi:hypothetical protein
MIAALAMCGCLGSEEPAYKDGVASETADTSVPVEPVCPDFGEPASVGTVSDERVVEASGLAFADGRFWTHNDSGAPLLFGMTSDGTVDRGVTVDGVVVVDWEDIAARQGALWVADVGDNLAFRPWVTLYEIGVPGAGATEASGRGLQLTWPDGPVDCETLLADPVSGDLMLVSKDFSGESVVARVVDPQGSESALEEVARLQFGEGGIGQTTLVTGGDISPDGTMVLLRTYLSAWGFPRVPGEDWAATFAREPCEVPVKGEGQGEAVVWAEGAVWTVSEGQGPPLNRTAVLDPLRAASRGAASRGSGRNP